MGIFSDPPATRHTSITRKARASTTLLLLFINRSLKLFTQHKQSINNVSLRLKLPFSRTNNESTFLATKKWCTPCSLITSVITYIYIDHTPFTFIYHIQYLHLRTEQPALFCSNNKWRAVLPHCFQSISWLSWLFSKFSQISILRWAVLLCFEP